MLPSERSEPEAATLPMNKFDSCVVPPRPPTRLSVPVPMLVAFTTAPPEVDALTGPPKVTSALFVNKVSEVPICTNGPA